MTLMEGNLGPGHSHGEHGPWMHIIGFVLSIVLTLIALRLVLANAFHPAMMVTVILSLAVLQILVQLFFFMHITESHGPKYHVLSLLLGAVFTIAIVAGSIWIMTFGGYQAY